MDPPYELLAENGLYHLDSFDFEKLSDYVKIQIIRDALYHLMVVTMVINGSCNQA